MAEAKVTALGVRAASREADDPRDSLLVRFGPDKPLKLDAGVDLSPFQIAYNTYGTLNSERSNAVLICHALTGDQHVASIHPITGKPGWWETMVGPGKPIDTERYFIICPNVVGACMGSTGPCSTNPKTGKPWGLDFPVITIRDMVRAQAMLLDHLGIASLFAVAGGSMGGMQVLQWAVSYPERVFAALPIACSTRHSAQNIAFHEVGRQAVMADPEWRSGRYLSRAATRGAGSRSRAWAHTSPICPTPRCIASSAAGCRTAPIRRSRSTPISRSNPICVTRASRSSNASTPIPTSISRARWTISTSRRTMTASSPTPSSARRRGSAWFRSPSDWLFPTSDSRSIVHALNAAGARVSFAEIATDKGHDAFLLEEPELFAIVRGFLDGAGKARGLVPGRG